MGGRVAGGSDEVELGTSVVIEPFGSVETVGVVIGVVAAVEGVETIVVRDPFGKVDIAVSPSLAVDVMDAGSWWEVVKVVSEPLGSVDVPTVGGKREGEEATE